MSFDVFVNVVKKVFDSAMQPCVCATMVSALQSVDFHDLFLHKVVQPRRAFLVAEPNQELGAELVTRVDAFTLDGHLLDERSSRQASEGVRESESVPFTNTN
jgi:hypothetical protein